MLSKRLFDAIASAVDLDDPAEQSLDVVGFENTESVQIKMCHQCTRSPVAQVGRLFHIGEDARGLLSRELSRYLAAPYLASLDIELVCCRVAACRHVLLPARACG
ncbi:hypothetical protein AKG95_14010 [Janthinobacterium lividum]|uniref:Uncharacterized protein n=1 Tax=Janthinobacterium lividum TaxID=29581 RepID=A0A1S1U8B0_9BURK|nr:hypothetical protein AKG95_14010 [Janthinobacterium lividum]